MQELELELESVQLLPRRETLMVMRFHGGHGHSYDNGYGGGDGGCGDNYSYDNGCGDNYSYDSGCGDNYDNYDYNNCDYNYDDDDCF
jgi:hypothetical protein